MTATDPVYARALERREAILRELHEVQSFLMMYREFSTEQAAPPAQGTHPEPAGDDNPVNGLAGADGPKPAERESDLEPDAQHGGAVEPAPPVPAANSPASARGPHTCGSGEAMHASAAASPPPSPASAPDGPPMVGGARPATEDPQPVEPANRGGADAQVDEPASNPQKGPVSQDAAPAPVSAPPARKGPGGDYRAGMSMQEKCDLVLPVLRDAVEPDGRVPLSLGTLAAVTGIPYDSVHGVLMKLHDQGLIRRKAGITRLLKHKPTAGAATLSETSSEAPKIDTLAATDPATAEPPQTGTNKPRVDVKRPAPQQAPLARNGHRPPVRIHGEELVSGDLHVGLGKPQRLILAKLLENWGRTVPLIDLYNEVKTFTELDVTAASRCTELKALAKLNALIKPVGLVVHEDKSTWQLAARQEAGVPA